MNDRLLINPARLRRLLCSMVDIYSPSGKEDEISSFLATYCRRAGIQLEKQEVDEDRDNLLLLPDDGEPEVLLVGHIDTVPAYDYDTFGVQDRGEVIEGLGTADMKGGCAAMVEAFVRLNEAGVRLRRGGLALVVGEEESGDGSAALIREIHAPYAVIGEPTDLKPCLSHFSYLEVQLETEGARVHASQARKSRNAIRDMLLLLEEVVSRLQTDHPAVVCNIRDMASSQAGFAVPEYCEAWLDLHVPPSEPLDALTGHLETILADLRERQRALKATLTFHTIHHGYTLPERGTLVERFRTAFALNNLPWEPTAFPSHSDANLLWSAGIKPVLFGPGRLEDSHCSDESVLFAQVASASQAYLDLLTGLSRD